MTHVKICGITTIEDAQIVCEQGADAIGLVFYPPSKRFVEIAQARKICASLTPFTSSVALFVNAQRQQIEHVLEQVDIDIIQFHGDESEAFCNSFQRPYIKALRMKEGVDLVALENDYASARGLLLDTYKKGIPGGTGETFNWDKVPHNLSKPIILAGGLLADNVTQAIEQVGPYAVDVSGGVEYSSIKKEHQGLKDPFKVKQFIAQARNAINSN